MILNQIESNMELNVYLLMDTMKIQIMNVFNVHIDVPSVKNQHLNVLTVLKIELLCQVVMLL